MVVLYTEKLCRMPGCNQQCFIERGRVHDFCGKTHAREYKAMTEEFERQKVREKRTKLFSFGSGRGSSHSNSSAIGAGGGWSQTRSGATYGMPLSIASDDYCT